MALFVLWIGISLARAMYLYEHPADLKLPPAYYLDDYVLRGDTASYKKLMIFLKDEPQALSLGYSYIMAYRYHYRQAYYDVYQKIRHISEVYWSGFENADEETRELALKSLCIAADSGFTPAQEEWTKIKDDKFFKEKGQSR